MLPTDAEVPARRVERVVRAGELEREIEARQRQVRSLIREVARRRVYVCVVAGVLRQLHAERLRKRKRRQRRRKRAVHRVIPRCRRARPDLRVAAAIGVDPVDAVPAVKNLTVRQEAAR